MVTLAVRRRAWASTYREKVESGRRGDAVECFITQVVGMLQEFAPQARSQPAFDKKEECVMVTPASNVDEYIAQAPTEVQPKLHELREVIRAAVPEAQERISYGMPFYEYKGRLVYFAYAKKHIGLYALITPVLAEHADELKSRVTPKGTVHLPLNEELPTGLVKRLVEAQARYNDEASS